MNPSPVGMRCPECAGQGTKVRGGAAALASSSVPYATYVLIALNVIAFLAEIGSGSGGLSYSSAGDTLIQDGGVNGPMIADGEWYRLITAGFLHAGLIHIGFNMFALYVLGTLLEPAIGRARFVAIYFAALLGGSLGALLLDPAANTVGASGAIFGLFAACFLVARGRGLEGVASQIGFWLLINLVLTISVPGISVGGHLGGLAVGALAGLIVVAGERGATTRRHTGAEVVFIAALAATCFALGLAVA
jgi:membrane associated rhomboid family serine protease